MVTWLQEPASGGVMRQTVTTTTVNEMPVPEQFGFGGVLEIETGFEM